jgi:hypothetical protein
VSRQAHTDAVWRGTPIAANNSLPAELLAARSWLRNAAANRAARSGGTVSGDGIRTLRRYWA